MSLEADSAENRHLLPGERIVKRYQKIKLHAKFSAILTDRRLLFLRRSAAEDVHLQAVSSIGWQSKPRWELIAAGAMVFAVGFFAASNSSQLSVLFIVGGISLMVAGALLRRHGVTVYAVGRTLFLTGNSQTLTEFLRDVRLEQMRFSAFIPTGLVLPPSLVYAPPQAAPFYPAVPPILSQPEVPPHAAPPVIASLPLKSAPTVCTACSTPRTDDSSFCTKCGTRWPSVGGPA